MIWYYKKWCRAGSGGPWLPVRKVPLALGGPCTLRGNSKGGEEVVWETSAASFHCYFYLIHSHPPTPRPFFNLLLSVFVFFVCVFCSYNILSFILNSQLCCLLYPLTLLLLCVPPLCLPSPSMFEVRPICPPLSPHSELCLLAISYFLSASSPSSSSSSTKVVRLHDRLCHLAELQILPDSLSFTLRLTMKAP